VSIILNKPNALKILDYSHYFYRNSQVLEEVTKDVKYLFHLVTEGMPQFYQPTHRTHIEPTPQSDNYGRKLSV
jgi:hypothetical protein